MAELHWRAVFNPTSQRNSWN